MTDNAGQGTGDNAGQNGQGDGGSDGQQWTPPTQAEWDALQTKTKDLEADNFNYRSQRREGNGTQQGSQNTGAQGQGSQSSSAETELATLKTQMVTNTFRHAVEMEATKRGSTNPQLLAKMASQGLYAEADGTVTDMEAMFKDLKDLYPQLFRNVGSVNGGSRSETPTNLSFSDQIRENFKG